MKKTLILDGVRLGSCKSEYKWTQSSGFGEFQRATWMFCSLDVSCPSGLAPEKALEDGLLPTLEVLDPMGEVSTYRPTERVTFAEPYTGTNYVVLLVHEGVALGGIYEITIKGKAASRFTVSVGKIEQFGTAVEDIENRDLGVAGVMDWYASEDVMDTDVVTPDETSTAPASDNSGVVLLVVLVALGVVAVVGAKVRKGRKPR